jgi:hypothetical protein
LTRGATSHALLVNDRGIVHAVEGVESHVTILLLKWLGICYVPYLAKFRSRRME